MNKEKQKQEEFLKHTGEEMMKMDLKSLLALHELLEKVVDAKEDKRKKRWF